MREKRHTGHFFFSLENERRGVICQFFYGHETETTLDDLKNTKPINGEARILELDFTTLIRYWKQQNDDFQSNFFFFCLRWANLCMEVLRCKDLLVFCL